MASGGAIAVVGGTMTLKQAHYAALSAQGYSDEEIEKDWQIFIEEYEQFILSTSTPAQ